MHSRAFFEKCERDLCARVGNYADFISKIALIIDQWEQAEASRLLLDSIGSIIGFKFALAVVHLPDSPPVHLADTFTRPLEKQALSHYLDNTYILNPVYNAYKKGLKEGVYRMRDLAPDHYFSSDYYHQFKAHALAGEEIGYKTYGWPTGMEELLITIDLPEGKMGEISLSRASSDGGFDDVDLQKIEQIAPLIAAMYRRLWQQVHRKDKPQGFEPKDSVTGELLLKSGKSILGDGCLSRRESEIAHMILQGHSSQSISLHLNISLTTVKTHRRNIYIKLNISTQQELFAAFLNALSSQKNRA